jgi:hypothetical protein
MTHASAKHQTLRLIPGALALLVLYVGHWMLQLMLIVIELASAAPRLFRVAALLAAAALAFCIAAEGKQPSPEEIGPTIFACEVREPNGRRFITLPAWVKVCVTNWEYLTNVVEYKYVLPAGWQYYHAGDNGIDPLPNHFYRGKEKLLLDEMLDIGGLPW